MLRQDIIKGIQKRKKKKKRLEIIGIVKRLPSVLGPHRVQDLRRVHSVISRGWGDMSRVRRERCGQVHAGGGGLRKWDAVVHRIGLCVVGVVAVVGRV